MTDVLEILSRHSNSPFLSRIHLGEKEIDYLRKKGMSEVLEHAAEYMEKRLAPAFPANERKN